MILKPMTWWSIVGAGIVAGAGALFFAQARTGSTDGYALRSRDSGEYLQLARNLVEHGVYSQDDSPPYRPDTWRTPGYPLFLGMVMLLFGRAPLAAIVVQQLLCVANGLLLAMIVRPVATERRAWLAGVLMVLEPYHRFYALWLLPTTPFSSAVLVLWLVWNTAVLRENRMWALTLGATSALLVLLWPLAILLPVAMTAGVAWIGLRRRRTHRLILRQAALSAAGALVMIFPWMVRTRLEAGHLALSHQSGIVMAYFKATEIVLWQQGRSADRYIETSLDPENAHLPHTVWEDIDARLRNAFAHLPAEQLSTLQWSHLAQGNKTAVDSFEISRALWSIGWEYVTSAPLTSAVCCASRCAAMLTFPLQLFIEPPSGQARRLAHLAAGLIYTLLAGAVILRLLLVRRPLEELFFPLAVAMCLLLAATPQLDPRFRVPIIPVILFLALARSYARKNPPV